MNGKGKKGLKNRMERRMARGKLKEDMRSQEKKSQREIMKD